MNISALKSTLVQPYLVDGDVYADGVEAFIEAAHVLPTALRGSGRGIERRFRDVLNHPDKYRPMCRRCHRMFDKLVKLKLAEREESVNEEPLPF